MEEKHHHHHHEDSCECEHEGHHHEGCHCEEGIDLAEEEENQDLSLKNIIILWTRVGLSAVLAFLGQFLFTEDFFIAHGAPWWINLLIMIAALLMVAYDIFLEAIKTIFSGESPFDECVLMSVASLGAFCLRFFGENEAFEGILVMLLYQVGEFFQDLATDRSKDAILSAIDMRDEKVDVLLENGQIVKKKPQEIQIGDIAIMKVGEKALCDGVVEEGEAFFDESSYTGEFVPVRKSQGSPVYAGTILKTGSIKLKASKEYKDSAVAKLMELVKINTKKKSKTDRFITKFARIYTPSVMGAALLAAILPPLINLGVGWGEVGTEWARWIQVALTFLVVSCPCSVVISVPLAFFSGIGLASKNGIIVKGAEYFDALNDLGYVVFDKTGTLTLGNFKLSKLHPNGVKEEELLHYVTAAECRSTHPIGLAICEGKDLSSYEKDISSYEEISGKGVYAVYKGKELLAGRSSYLEEKGILVQKCDELGSVVYVAYDDQFIGAVIVNDSFRPTSKKMIEELNQMGVKTVLLSGDVERNVIAAGNELGISECHGGLKPEEKSAHLEELIAKKDGAVAFVGDGINDAPSIVLSDVGVAMGGFGSDLVVQNAAVVLMGDDPEKIVTLKKIAKKSESKAKINILVSLIIKLGIMLLTIIFQIVSIATGNLIEMPLWVAVFADSGLALALTLHSLSLLHSKL